MEEDPKQKDTNTQKKTQRRDMRGYYLQLRCRHQRLVRKGSALLMHHVLPLLLLVVPRSKPALLFAVAAACVSLSSLNNAEAEPVPIVRAAISSPAASLK